MTRHLEIRVLSMRIYYPENFLKTSLCVKGNKLLYEYITKKINHKKYGKYIISSNPSEEAKLKKFLTGNKIRLKFMRLIRE